MTLVKSLLELPCNDILYISPKLHNDLFDALFWFRQFYYVFTDDTEKKCRQIKIHYDDKKLQ